MGKSVFRLTDSMNGQSSDKCRKCIAWQIKKWTLLHMSGKQKSSIRHGTRNCFIRQEQPISSSLQWKFYVFLFGEPHKYPRKSKGHSLPKTLWKSSYSCWLTKVHWVRYWLCSLSSMEISNTTLKSLNCEKFILQNSSKGQTREWGRWWT